MTVSAVSPWRTALPRDACLPVSVFGPVLLRALRRLASIWRYEVMERRFPNWVRFGVLISPYHFRLAMDVSLAKGHGPRRLDRYLCHSTTQLHRGNHAPRGDGPGIVGR